MHSSISTLGFSVPLAGRASEYVQIHCVYMTPRYSSGGIREGRKMGIFKLDIPQRKKMERTAKQGDCVRSPLFDTEHRRFPCINVASKQAPYCSFSPYSTQWKFKLLNWIAAVQVRLRSHVCFFFVFFFSLCRSSVLCKKKRKKKIQCAVYSSLWLQHTVISLLYRCLKTVWIWLYESAFSQREAPSAALS